MGLAQTQDFLAQLYTDSGLRTRFFADPHGVGMAVGLAADLAAQLAELSSDEVTFFAHSLQRKRLNEVRKLLPLTDRALGMRFVKLFLQYAESHIPKGIKKHGEDALAFAAYVERVARAQRVGPAWVVDLIRYESAWVNVHCRPRRWQVRWYRHPVDKLVRGLMDDRGTTVCLRRPTIGLWLRFSRRSKLWHAVVSLPPLTVLGWVRRRRAAPDQL